MRKVIALFKTYLQKIKALDLRALLEIQLELRPYLQGVPYWTAAGIVGVWAVVYSGFFTESISLSRLIYLKNPYYLFVVSPLCFLAATWLVEKFAPAAGGTGIPKVIRALELDAVNDESEIQSFLSLRVALIIAASSLLSMIGGGSLGREGPMVHMAACLFYYVGKHFHRYWPYTEHRSWIVAGGAAGVAAAFNAPLAGVVFVLEELAQQHFHKFKTVVISAAIMGGIVSQWISGKYLYFGYPKLLEVPLSSIPWAILVGGICGLLAFPFHLIVKIDWRSKVPHYFQTRLAFAFLVGIIMAALALFLDASSIGGGVSVIEQLLFTDKPASWEMILARFFGPILSHLSGCAGGFLAPSLALGAAIGSKLATLFSYSNHNLLVLVGMSAFLSAIVRAPFTAWVVVMEMTDRHQAIFPLMIASLVSHGIVSLTVDRKAKSLATPQ